MKETRAWLFDLYADPQDDLVLWFITEEGARLRLCQPFPVTFYAAGPDERLRQLQRSLQDQAVAVRLEYTVRRDLFAPQPVKVLAIEVVHTDAQPALFHQASRQFPDLTYYDADIPMTLRYAARYGTFGMAYCIVSHGDDAVLQDLKVINSPWDLDPPMPALRILSLDPDVNGLDIQGECVWVQVPISQYGLSLQPERSFLVNLRSILQAHDPDLLLTTWGDTWLLPELQRLCRRARISLPLNRDTRRSLARRGERTYFSYGQVIHRGQQIHLFGRWHIDRCNAMLWGDYGLEGILELGRVTALPLQTAARVSPGTGISSMQILTALRKQVLVPWHKQQVEALRPADELFYADQGGLVYQPLIGLHRDVAEVDFISMYPSIMAHFNISPETIGSHRPGAEPVPELGLSIDNSQEGLVPQTLKPLLEKRIALKFAVGSLAAWEPRRKRYQASVSAHKWLLVTCFGYLGYKNARFGRIEAHQAVTAYGREALLRAKEAAEEQGYQVLHLFVDGIWVKKPGARAVNDFQPLLDEIAACTRLPIALDGVYRWVAFLPSRQDDRVPVANRYFGVFQDGSLKVRGIEARRLDTPPFIARMQMEMLQMLAKAPHADALPDYLPDLLALLRRTLTDLHQGRIPLGDHLVTQKLSRELEEYRSLSPMAQAVAQLKEVGKRVSPGQRVRFLYTRGKPRARAWDLPTQPLHSALDIPRYRTLLLRAASTIFQPLGIDEETLRQWALGRAVPLSLPGSLALVNF